MPDVTAKIAWWQFLVLLSGTGSAVVVTTEHVERTTERIVTEQRVDPSSAIQDLSASVDILRFDMKSAINNIYIPDHTEALGGLSAAVRAIPAPLPYPDYANALGKLQGSVDKLPAIMASLEETLKALPDSHVVRLSIRREGNSKFTLKVSEGRVYWSRDE